MNRRTSWIFVSCLVLVGACGGNGRPGTLNGVDPNFSDIGSGDGSAGAGEGGTRDAASDVATPDGTVTMDGSTCASGLMACGTACSDVLNDPMNCGHCGNACMAGAHMVAVCTSGACQPAVCVRDFGDCNHMASDGCETALNTVGNCGACGTMCAAPTPLCVTASGTTMDAGTADAGAGDASAGDADAGDADAGDAGARDAGAGDAGTSSGYTCGAMCLTGTAACGTTCTDLNTDSQNCGMCAHACPAPAAAMAACAMGVCGITCGSGTMDCNHMVADGCEVMTATDVANCGMCGNACPSAMHFIAACTAGTCRGACEMLWGDCNMMTADGCERDLSSDLDNCGGCGQRCRVTHGTSACTTGMCMIHCDPGYYQSGLACLPIPPPRLVGPVSGSFVTSRRPTLQWERGTVADSFLIQICRDRACATIATQIESNGSYVTPSADLDPGVLFWRARGGKDGSFGADASNVWEFVVGARTSTPSRSNWGSHFDANGDGLGDVVVGAPGSTGAYVFPGTATGVATTAAVTLTNSAMGFGQSVASAGDVDGDGFSDLIVGAPGDMRAFVYRGAATGIASAVSSMLTGGAGFGSAVAPAGDIDGDGYADILVGAPGDNSVRLYPGGNTGLTSAFTALHPPTGVTSFGTSVSGLGDTNGDGLNDVVVGAPDANTVFVFTGARVSGAVVLSSATVTRIAGPSGAMGFGSSVSCAGDVNGDGYMDVIVGAPGSGTAYLYQGALAGIATAPSATLTGVATARFGYVVTAVGDVDGDGFDDVAVGSTGGTPVQIFRGTSTGLGVTALDTLSAPAGLGASGLTVGGALLGSASRASVLLGDPGNNRVFVYLPGASTISATPGVTLSASSGQFGASVYSAFR